MQELSFIDPVFNSKLILIKNSKKIYELIKPEFDRLNDIANLGLIAHINDITYYSKHQHLVGLWRLFQKIQSQPKSYGLPERFIWSFWCRLCFAQIGHASFAYDAEKAILLACHSNEEFLKKLLEFVEPIIKRARIQKCSCCTYCKNEKFSLNQQERRKIFNNLINSNNWKRLYLWIAALKLYNMENLINELKTFPQFKYSEAFNILINPLCKWNEVIENINKLDYVSRDSVYIGMRINFDIDNILAYANKAEHSKNYWDILNYCNTILTKTTYADYNMQTHSGIFQRTLADLLIAGDINLEQLFGMGSNSLNDKELKEIICKKKKKTCKLIKELFNPETRGKWHTWNLKIFQDLEENNFQIENLFTNIKQTHKKNITDFTQTKIIAYKSTINKNELCYSIRCDDSEKPDLKRVMKIISRNYCKFDPLDSMKFLTEFITGFKIKHKLLEIVDFLGEHSTGLKEEIFTVLKRYNKLFKFDPYLSYSDFGELTKIFTFREPTENIDLNVVYKYFWKQLLMKQPIYLSNNKSKSINNLLTAAKNIFSELLFIGDNGINKGKIMEIYAFLEALTFANENAVFKIVLPNIELFYDEKPENEYDILSFTLGREIKIYIWNVTTVQPTALREKQRNDSLKIRKLERCLKFRWADQTNIEHRTIYISHQNRVIHEEWNVANWS